VKYVSVIERDREEIEILLSSGYLDDVCDGLLCAAYYDPDWRWVQERCLEKSYHADSVIRRLAATCLGHLARIHRKLDLERVLSRLVAMREDREVSGTVQDALDDIRHFLKFQ
jgi:hypothetical protein